MLVNKLSISLVFLVFLFFGGCATEATIYETDPTFDSFVSLFEDVYHVHSNVPIIFSDDMSDKNGLCVRYSANSAYNYVKINRAYWKKSSYYGRHQLIFHELGHCVLGLNHDSTLIVKDMLTIPKSIMYPYSFGNDFYYQLYIIYYIGEMRP